MGLVSTVLVGCGQQPPADPKPATGAEHTKTATPGAEAAQQAREQLDLIKLVSWAELAPAGCRIDIEGTSEPARFQLDYSQPGKPPVHLQKVDEIEPAGWSMVNRSERGYGFERAGPYTSLSMDAVEELRCTCRSPDGRTEWKQQIPIHVTLDWRPGSAPRVRGFMGEGDKEEVDPVVVGGRLALYQFSFEYPVPKQMEGRCASGFLAALSLSEPLDTAGSTPDP